MSAESLREQAEAMRGMADELETIADNMEQGAYITEQDLDALRKDYSPEPDDVHRLQASRITSEYPQVRPDELQPLTRFDRPDYVIFIRHDLNIGKVVDDARYLARDHPTKVIAFEFPNGDKFKFVPRED